MFDRITMCFYSTMRIKLLQAVYLLDGYEKAMSCARRGPDIDTKIFEKLSMYSFTPSEGNSDTNQQSVLMFCEVWSVVDLKLTLKTNVLALKLCACCVIVIVPGINHLYACVCSSLVLYWRETRKL